MDMINISKIIDDKNVKKNLPTQFNKKEHISTIYTLTKTIQSKMFNQEEFIKALETKSILDNMNYLFCNCTYCTWRHSYCPKQQTKKTTLQRSQIQGTSLC